ncbi:MAG TPA: GAF domain-containing protein [Candidatus Krumholzibacteria bacterium]|nr:GAF domain-containing protein [Candidatus Krumholzibacteria bacterium]
MSSIKRNINHGTHLNWFVMVTVCGVGATGLFYSLPSLTARFDAIDLVENAQTAFLMIAAASVFILGGLVLQRRDLNRLWRDYLAAQKEIAERAEKHAARVYALLNVSKMMVAQNDIAAVFNCVTDTCVDVFTCHQASLMIFDKDNNSLEVRAASGKMVPEGIIGTRQQLGVGIAGWVGMRREPLLILPGGKPADYPGVEFKQTELSAAMVVPIILRDELVGVINVSSRSKRIQFDSEDMRALLVFAENVGVAIRHTEQAEWMRATIQHLQSQNERHAAPRTAPAGNPA